MRTPQTSTELRAHLDDQIAFLQASADAFDQGFEAEAKRLAVTIRVLLRDTNRQQSLLGQLGMKTGVFPDTCFGLIPGNKAAFNGLTEITLDPKGVKHTPKLDSPGESPRGLDFDHWWTAPVYVGTDGQVLTRQDLVLIMAEQDGGAHVDPTLDARYNELSRRNASGWIAQDSRGTRPMDGPERAAVRQIAHELLKKLIPGYTKIPSSEGPRFGGFFFGKNSS